MAGQSEVVSAAQSGDIEKLRGLLQDDPSLASARDASGVSALMHAYYRRQQTAADLLLSTNSSLDIFEATAADKADKVSAILETDPEAAKSWSADGFTALHFAAFFNRPAIARDLIRHGADVAAVARNPMKVMSAQRGRSAQRRDRSPSRRKRSSSERSSGGRMGPSPRGGTDWRQGNGEGPAATRR